MVHRISADGMAGWRCGGWPAAAVSASGFGRAGRRVGRWCRWRDAPVSAAGAPLVRQCTDRSAPRRVQGVVAARGCGGDGIGGRGVWSIRNSSTAANLLRGPRGPCRRRSAWCDQAAEGPRMPHFFFNRFSDTESFDPTGMAGGERTPPRPERTLRRLSWLKSLGGRAVRCGRREPWRMHGLASAQSLSE